MHGTVAIPTGSGVLADAPPARPLRLRLDLPAAAWDAYVAGHPGASRYHYFGWGTVVARAFGRDVRRLAVESASGIAGVLPLVIFRSRLFGRFAVSMPFLNAGGVLADSPLAERALLEAAIAEAERAGASHLELRHTAQKFPELPSRQHKVAMVLDLATTRERQWQALDRKVRNQVRKAEKHGLTIRTGGGELLQSFYHVFARTMRDLGTPVYPRRWFEEVVATFPANTRVVCVLEGEQPAAAGLVYWQRDAIEVPWAAALRQYNSVCANMLLYWAMLGFSIDQGLKQFDFGRSTRGGGTYQFKRQWGAQPHDLVWEYWCAPAAGVPDLSPQNPRYRLAIESWKRLPLRIANALGPRLVRHIP